MGDYDELVEVLRKISKELNDINTKLSDFKHMISKLETVANLLSTNAQKFYDLSVKLEKTVNEFKYVSSLMRETVEEVYAEISSPEEEKIRNPVALKVYKFIKTYVRQTGQRFIDIEDIAKNLKLSEDEVIEAITELINVGIRVRLTTIKEEKEEESKSNK